LVLSTVALACPFAAVAASRRGDPLGPHWKPVLASACNPRLYHAGIDGKGALYGKRRLAPGYVCRRPTGKHGFEWGVLLADGSVHF
jgi:hypothetical protein